jgi:pimeloyl-ACP methyl ester carboxylesterase
MARLKQSLFRIIAALCGFVFFILLAGFTYEQIGRSQDASRLPPRIGRAVDVGGRTLNLYCSGDGSPAVIFETGGNSPGYEWTAVQTSIAGFTRACWYDRAGVGWSDPPPSPRTSVSVASDLHEILRRASVPPPYVLVGASIGGEYARIYAGHYPQEVAGLVLVDSSHPDQQEPPFMLSPLNRMSPHARELICTALPFMSRFGVLRFMASRMRRPVPSQASTQQEILAKLNAQPKQVTVDAEQACAATNDGRFVPTAGSGNPELDNAARNSGNLGDRPLIVLTAGRYWASPGLEKQAADYHEIWVHQLQASLAQLSSRGRQVVVDAHHDMSEAPDAVVSATRQVVEEVRAEK